MILSPEHIKLILRDPKAYMNTPSSEIGKRKMEKLLTSMLFEKDEASNSYIVEVAAPGSQKATELILSITEAINRHLGQVEEISEQEIRDIQLNVAARLEISEDEIANILSKYKEYYDFALAKQDKIVVTKEEIARVKEIRKQMVKLNVYTVLNAHNYNQISQKVLLHTGSELSNQVYEMFSPLMRINEDGDPYINLAVNEAGTWFGLRRERCTYHTDRISYNAALDMLDVFPQDRKIVITNVHFVKGSLRDYKEIINDDLYLDIALSEYCFNADFATRFAKYKATYLVLLIDDKNYVGLVQISDTFMIQCRQKLQKDLEVVTQIRRSNIFDNFPDFKHGYLAKI